MRGGAGLIEGYRVGVDAGDRIARGWQEGQMERERKAIADRIRGLTQGGTDQPSLGVEGAYQPQEYGAGALTPPEQRAGNTPIGTGGIETPNVDAYGVGAVEAHAPKPAATPIRPDAMPMGAQGAPSSRRTSFGDVMSALNDQVAFDIKWGKMNAAGLAQYMGTLQKMKDEGYGKAIAMMDAGNIDAGVRHFNEIGDDRGWQVKTFDQGQTEIAGQKMPTTMVTLVDRNGNERVIDTKKTMFSMGSIATQLDSYQKAERNKLETDRLRLQEKRDESTATRANAYYEFMLSRAKTEAERQDLLREQRRLTGARADNVEDGYTPDGRDPNAPGGRGAGGSRGSRGGRGGDDGPNPEFWQKHQPVRDDIRREVIARFGAKNPDPMKSDPVDSPEAQAMSDHAERMYQHYAESATKTRQRPLSPATIANILKQGEIQVGALDYDGQGNPWLVDRVKVTGKDGQPRFYYTGEKRRATPQDVDRLGNMGRKNPVPQPGEADTPDAIRNAPATPPVEPAGVQGAPAPVPAGAGDLDVNRALRSKPGTPEFEEAARTVRADREARIALDRQQSTAKAAQVQQAFAEDAKTMDRRQLARKYLGQRAMLTPEQARMINRAL